MPPNALSDEFVREIRQVIAWYKNLRGPGIRNTPWGPAFSPTRAPQVNRVNAPAAAGLTRLRIKEELTNWLRCRSWDGTTEGGTDVYVAKQQRWRSTVVGSSVFPVDGEVIAADTKTTIFAGPNGPITLIDMSTINPAAGSLQARMVLQISGSGYPVWDWTRAH